MPCRGEISAIRDLASNMSVSLPLNHTFSLIGQTPKSNAAFIHIMN